MKIRRFLLQNITSYRHRTVFSLDARLNILIGPNGGGKSNFQKTLALVLSTYFIHQYEFTANDQEHKIAPVDLWTKRNLQRKLARHLDEPGDQLIEIDLAPEASDLANINTIAANLERFNEYLEFYESPYQSYTPAPFVEAISATSHFSYTIRNLTLVDPEADTAAWAFREYLRTFFIFLRLAARIPEVNLTSPVFFFFSERSSSRQMDVQSSQITEQNYFSGFRSAYAAAMGDSFDLLQWGAQHFARLHWRAVNEAGKSKELTTQDVFAKEPDVQLLTRYMDQLGYGWNFLTDQDSVSYYFVLRKHGDSRWFTADKFSSGEREIVHFLLALFALNVKDGVVLVDEPELHLHPRWQAIFLGLFRDLSPERNNQFIVSTHSPIFVTPDTINSIIRIFRDPVDGSKHIALREIDLPEKKSLVRMINTQNNERVFFADKVVLVEGITDRLVMASLLDATAVRFKSNQAIEIVEVGGKGNFADYQSLLNSLLTPTYVVADRDYLTLVGSADARRLFTADPSKQWEVLRDKKSTDGIAMMALLEQAVGGADLAHLRDFLEYLRSRTQRIKDPLTPEEQGALNGDIDRLAQQGTFVLREGELEAYLPVGATSIRSLVDTTTDRNWLLRCPTLAGRVELASIAASIVGVSDAAFAPVRNALDSGTPPYPSGLLVEG